MYIRLLAKGDGRGKEVLIHINSIWKIEVIYSEEGELLGEVTQCCTSLDRAFNDPNAKRWYKLFVGSDEFFLRENPNSKVMQVIEEIYKKSTKDD